MNTLPATVTARFFPIKDSYNAFRDHWSALMNSDRKHELSASHHLLYLALLGKDWRKAFTPPANRRKLENGAFLGWSMFRVLQALHNPLRAPELLAPFDGFIPPSVLQELRTFLPLISPYAFPAEKYAERAYPFDAYKDGTYAIVKLKGESHE